MYNEPHVPCVSHLVSNVVPVPPVGQLFTHVVDEPLLIQKFLAYIALTLFISFQFASLPADNTSFKSGVVPPPELPVGHEVLQSDPMHT